MIIAELKPPPVQKPDEHIGIVAHVLLQFGGRLAALKNADTHEEPAVLLSAMKVVARTGGPQGGVFRGFPASPE